MRRNLNTLKAALLVCFVLFSTSSAQELQFISSSLWGRVNTIKTAGHYAFAAFHDGLVIYDISNPGQIEELSNIFCDGAASDLEVAGNYVFIADGTGGLRIIDVSAPENPIMTGQYDTPGFCYSVFVVDNLAYLADGEYGIWIVDISDKNNPSLLGGRDTPGYAYDFVGNTQYAYVADGNSGVQIMDVSNPSNPNIVGHLDSPYSVTSLYLDNDRMAVKAYSYYLALYDISDMRSPQLIDTLSINDYLAGMLLLDNYILVSTYSDLRFYALSGNSQIDSVGIFNFENQNYIGSLCLFGPNLICSSLQNIITLELENFSQPRIISNIENNGYAQNLLILDSLAFIADGDDGLQIYDVGDPLNPSFVGYYDSPGYSWGVAVSGDYAYLADGNSGVAILDISDPTDPSYASGIPSGYDVWDVVVDGDYAYIANDYWGIMVYDVSDPLSPTFIFHYDTPGYARDIAIEGNYAYVCDVTYGLLVFDISDPYFSELVGEYTGSDNIWGVAIMGNRAYLADLGQLTILDISDPQDPSLLGSVETPGAAYGAAVVGDYCHLATWEDGIQVIDVSDSENPVIIGSCDTPGYAERIAIDNNLGYVADGYSGIQIMELRNPLNPEILGNKRIYGTKEDLKVDGQYVYVADNNFTQCSMEIIDVSDQFDPVIAGEFPTGGNYIENIDINGNYAYLATFSNKLINVNIADKSSPDTSGWLNTDHWTWQILVDGNIGYLSEYDYNFQEGAIHLVNLSIPEAPSIISTLDNYGECKGFAKRGSYLYASVSNTIFEFDVSNINNPQQVSFNYGYYPQGLAVDGDYLYVADSDSGLAIYDIANPPGFSLVGELALPGAAMDVAMIGDKLAVGTMSDGLFIIDISDPQNPVQEAHSAIPRDIYSIDAEGDYIYVADNLSLKIFAYSQTGIDNGGSIPGHLALSQNYPNPFNAETSIEYSLGEQAQVTIDIYDLLGRRVSRLEPGVQSAGKHSVRWHADDLASGVYFYILRAADRSETKKMILLK